MSRETLKQADAAAGHDGLRFILGALARGANLNAAGVKRLSRLQALRGIHGGRLHVRQAQEYVILSGLRLDADKREPFFAANVGLVNYQTMKQTLKDVELYLEQSGENDGKLSEPA